METSINGETEPLLPISDAEPLLSASDVPNGSSHAVPSHIYAIEVAAALIGAGCSFLYLIVAIEYISSTTSTSPGPGCIVQRMVHRDKEYTIAVITAVGVLSAFSWLAAVVAGRVGGHSGITQHSLLLVVGIGCSVLLDIDVEQSMADGGNRSRGHYYCRPHEQEESRVLKITVTMTALLAFGLVVEVFMMSAPRAAVEAVVKAWPDAAMKKDSKQDFIFGVRGGETPVHLGMMWGSRGVIDVMAACPQSAKVVDKDGRTPLHRGLAAQDCHVDIIRAVIKAYPRAILERDQFGKTPLLLGMQARNVGADVVGVIIEACPDAILHLDPFDKTPLHYAIKYKEQKSKVVMLNCLLKPLSMSQFVPRDHSGDDTAAAHALPRPFDAQAGGERLSTLIALCASELKRTGYLYFSHRLHLTKAITEWVDASVQRASAALPKEQLQKMLPSKDLLADTAPLSERVAPIRDILSVCMQTDLQFSQTVEPATDFTAYESAYLKPVVEIINAELEILKKNVAAQPERYGRLLLSLSQNDKEIYDASFEKSSKGTFGDPDGYETMLKSCVDLEENCKLATVNLQPTANLFKLVLLTRSQIPAYKRMVTEVVDGVNLDMYGAKILRSEKAVRRPSSSKASTSKWDSKESQGLIKVIYRDQTKSLYRMVEKALTKGPNREYPDCSKIFDVYGCIIVCLDYASMAAVIDAFAIHHNKGGMSSAPVKITRIKDRWTEPSAGGWRDLMLNVVVNNVVFEVQVVLHSMYVARKALDAHKAYNQFRSFAEVFKLLKPDWSGNIRDLSEEGYRTASDDGGGEYLSFELEILKKKNQKLAAENDHLTALNKHLSERVLALEGKGGE